MKISELMQREVVTVGPAATLKEAATLLTQNRISGLPVVAPDGRLVGVVSEADILRKEDGFPLELASFVGRLLDGAYAGRERFEARTVEQMMTAPPITISSSSDVVEAARLMTRRDINRLPVVDRDHLVGIVSRADLVRAFQRDDESIEREIADDVLLSTLWIEPGAVEVTVDDGVVTLTGAVETKTVAQITAAYVRRVPGVVAVESHLEWRVDDRTRRRRTFAGRRA